MDPGYSRHSSATRRNHLDLAPLTRLPLRREEYDTLSAIQTDQPHSYLQPRSAPTTPRFPPYSPVHPRRRRSVRIPETPAEAEALKLQRSKSSGQLPGKRNSSKTHNRTHHHGHKSATTAPSPTTRTARTQNQNQNQSLFDADFITYLGEKLSATARRGKDGWDPARRSSSASLAGLPAADPNAYPDYSALTTADEYRAACAFVAAASSRRGSRDSYGPSASSPAYSRYASRSHSASRAGFGAGLGGSRPLTPAERRELYLAKVDDYFGDMERENGKEREKEPWEIEAEKIPGPDFVNVDEPLDLVEEGEEEEGEEEDEVDPLVEYRESLRKGFLGPLLLWLFAGNGKEDERDDEEEEEDLEEIDPEEFERQRQLRRTASLKRLQECTIVPLTSDVPPPEEDTGGWTDASWLLMVAGRALWG